MTRIPKHPCPNCKSYARVRTPAGEVICARCSTVLPPLPFAGRSAKSKNHRTPLRVGMKTRFADREFYAVGRIVYKSVGDVYIWEEWVLLHPDGEMKFLEFDEGKWTLTEQFYPSSAPDRGALRQIKPNSEGDFTGSIKIDGANAGIKDGGQCEVQEVEGEIPWEVKPGDRFHYLDAERSGTVYSVEIPPQYDEPLEWYKGRRLDDRAVFTLFDLRELLDKLNQREKVAGGRNKFGLFLLLAAFISLCGWMYALSDAGKTVAYGTHPINGIGANGVRYGPYTLTEANRVYRLNLTSDLREASAWVGATLEHQEAGEFMDLAGDFWDESGRDSDGYWHEASVHTRKDFQVTRPGSVYVRLFAEPEAVNRTAGATASFSLQEGVIYPAYLGWLGLGYMLLSLVMFISAAASLSSKVWEGMGEVKQTPTRQMKPGRSEL